MENILPKEVDLYNYQSIEIMREKAKFFAKELWNMDFDLPLVRNNRLRSLLGYYMTDDNDNPERIDMSGKLFREKYNELTIDAVLIHEQCHWYCDINGLPNEDTDLEFVLFLKKYGGATPYSISYVGEAHMGICSCCKQEVFSPKLKDIKKLRYTETPCCQADFTYTHDDYCEDEYKPSKLLKELNKKFRKHYKNKYKGIDIR